MMGWDPPDECICSLCEYKCDSCKQKRGDSSIKKYLSDLYGNPEPKFDCTIDKDLNLRPLLCSSDSEFRLKERYNDYPVYNRRVSSATDNLKPVIKTNPIRTFNLKPVAFNLSRTWDDVRGKSTMEYVALEDSYRVLHDSLSEENTMKPSLMLSDSEIEQSEVRMRCEPDSIATIPIEEAPRAPSPSQSHPPLEADEVLHIPTPADAGNNISGVQDIEEPTGDANEPENPIESTETVPDGTNSAPNFDFHDLEHASQEPLASHTAGLPTVGKLGEDSDLADIGVPTNSPEVQSVTKHMDYSSRSSLFLPAVLKTMKKIKDSKNDQDYFGLPSEIQSATVNTIDCSGAMTVGTASADDFDFFLEHVSHKTIESHTAPTVVKVEEDSNLGDVDLQTFSEIMENKARAIVVHPTNQAKNTVLQNDLYGTDVSSKGRNTSQPILDGRKLSNSETGNKVYKPHQQEGHVYGSKRLETVPGAHKLSGHPTLRVVSKQTSQVVEDSQPPIKKQRLEY